MTTEYALTIMQRKLPKLRHQPPVYKSSCYLSLCEVLKSDSSGLSHLFIKLGISKYGLSTMWHNMNIRKKSTSTSHCYVVGLL